ncbi:stage II sporulation protein M [Ammoniphilus sp. CFH 90114]|uniref:stage II sporulation protein M n=1 Tax=Ammoniphilus sp. CFH 90114 TaxID=2493665 RepID=UPI00100E158B|nr:stage II sporulation protein M [Ammoniphilus sp. CFH 90114]RXT13826.1 stage II sporulation protein M [Ammoniphilus sp. CFH 90114]
MRQSKFGQTIQLHLRENLSLYLFIIVLFTMGVSFGSVIVNSLSLTQKQELSGYLGEFFQVMHQGADTNPRIAFQHSIGDHLKYIGFMWILGLSIIGLPVILVMVFLKGLVIGFTVGFLVNQWSWNGLVLAGLSVLPQNLIAIPAIIIVGTAGISFSLRLIRSRFLRRGEPIYQHFLRYSALIVFMGVLLSVSSMFEAFVSPQIMKQIVSHVMK